ncbi:MAG: glycosyltransferase family 39 protein [Actinobacteria bacterium]|nr:glycosyltransferase family 39 protein [Actinomycetota bacterium]
MANSITVDKPPASLWVMALSVKVFGLNSWAILVPQALMGVASVGVLYATVKRWFGGVAGLIAGAILALTPIAALMFRYNNPDALLVLLLLLAAYAVVRATEVASWRWLALAGAFVGFAFLTKSLQAFLVLPAFALVYVIAAPTGLGKRIRDLVISFLVMLVSLGWWVAIVELWPADSRPYIGGSQDNSVLELIFGYNGFGRLTGDEAGSVVPGGGAGGGAGGGSPWGETSWHRMFDASWAGGIAWLLPAAFVLLVAGFVLTRKAPRTSKLRAGLILWAGWLVVTWAVFSFGGGIIHEYYAIALAPAIGAAVAMGAYLLWQRREQLAVRSTLAVVIVGSAAYGGYLLNLAGGIYSVLAVIVILTGLAAGGLMFLPDNKQAAQIAAGLGLAAVLLGPAAFTLDTATTPHSGSLPSAGPVLAGAQLRGPGQGGPGQGGPAGLAPQQDGTTTSPFGGPGGPGGQPFGAPGQNGFAGPGAQTPGGQGQSGPTGQPPGGAGPGAQGGPGGGLLNSPSVSDELVSVLNTDADNYTWVAAAVGSQTGAGYQLATGNSVMPIGGFNGSDPSPTLTEFQEYVANGQIHWFIAGGGGPGGGMGGPGGGGPGQSGSSSEISDWVEANFDSVTVDGVTLYDLSSAV